MSAILKRRSLPLILAASAALLLVLVFLVPGGGGSEGASTTGLSEYMPPDSIVYAETDLKLGAEASAAVDQAFRRLTGSKLSVALEKALSRSGKLDFDYRADVEPWLAGPVAVSMGEGPEELGMVIEASDPAEARAFLDEQETRAALGDEARTGVVGDSLVFASSDDQLREIASAYEGESLADTAAFQAMSEDLPVDGLATVYVASQPLIDAATDLDPEARALIEALGADAADAGTVMSLTTDGDRISLIGRSDIGSAVAADGAGSLVGSFPADAVLAIGLTGVGDTASTVFEALGRDQGDRSGSDRLGGLLDQASVLGIDFRELVASLDEVGAFVTGQQRRGPSGAIVATTSDPELIEDSIERLESLASFAGGESFRADPGGLDGFSLAFPGEAGPRIVVALSGDRLAIAAGLPAAKQALSGGGRRLADTALFEQAAASLPGGEVSLFARPALFDFPVGEKAGHSGKPAKRMAELASKVEFAAGGAGDDGTFEINLELED